MDILKIIAGFFGLANFFAAQAKTRDDKQAGRNEEKVDATAKSEQRVANSLAARNDDGVQRTVEATRYVRTRHSRAARWKTTRRRFTARARRKPPQCAASNRLERTKPGRPGA
jgi:ribosomal protein S13